jgi:hypothetical protein
MSKGSAYTPKVTLIISCRVVGDHVSIVRSETAGEVHGLGPFRLSSLPGSLWRGAGAPMQQGGIDFVIVFV